MRGPLTPQTRKNVVLPDRERRDDEGKRAEDEVADEFGRHRCLCADGVC